MFKCKFAVAAYCLIFLVSCSTLFHPHRRETIVLAGDRNVAQVCLGKSDVKLGDRVEVFESRCKQVQVAVIRTPRFETRCEKISKGFGEVIEASDEHYSRIRAAGDLNLVVGQLIEPVVK